MLGGDLCIMPVHKFNLNCYLQGQSCTRWAEAGLRPGPVYWLNPGTVFPEKSHVSFSGVHDMKEAVYCVPNEAALAILTDSPVLTEMELTCTGTTAIHSLQMTLDQIGLLRIVTSEVSGAYVYHGVWVITSIVKASAQSVLASMLDVTKACSPT